MDYPQCDYSSAKGFGGRTALETSEAFFFVLASERKAIRKTGIPQNDIEVIRSAARKVGILIRQEDNDPTDPIHDTTTTGGISNFNVPFCLVLSNDKLLY